MAWYGAAFDGPVDAGGLRLRLARRDDHSDVLAHLPDRINGVDQDPETKSWLAEAMIAAGYVLVAETGLGDVAGTVVIARRPDGPVEIGWSVGQAFAGRGHATAMASAPIGRLVPDVIDEVRCTIEPDNAASLRVAQKLGFAPAPGWREGAQSFARGGTAPAPGMAP